MPADIVRLAGSILSEPVRVEVTPPATTVDRIAQSVLYVEKSDKRALLSEVLRDPGLERVLVFTRTKHGADRVASTCAVPARMRMRSTATSLKVRASVLSRGFGPDASRCWSRPDIAARGIDVRDITHVINFDLPSVPETYVHRIGRTLARVGTARRSRFAPRMSVESLHAIEQEIRMSNPGDEHASRAATPPGSAGDVTPRTGAR